MPEPQNQDKRARFVLKPGTTLRQHSARGTIINGAFVAFLTSLGFLKGFVLAAFLTPSDYGVWGILLISLGTLTWLKQVGIGDKYIQQDDLDQEAAFHRAFTMELIVNTVLLVLLLLAVPVVAWAYGRSELLLPGFALCALIPAGQLQVPFWVMYRRLEFSRQRLLQALDPLVAFLATAGLAIAGAGYWAFIGGTLMGSYTGALVAMLTSRYTLRIRYDKGTLREYAQFSAPLFVASFGGTVVAQCAVFFGNDALGLVGAGAITLAAQVSQLAARVDETVSTTLYPVICAVADQRDLLFETFEKSNRIALMWAMPFGVGLALFSPDLVDFVLGDKWQPAVVALQATGLAAGISQIAFNWTSYFRALGKTGPIGKNALLQCVVFLACVPLMYTWDMDGYAFAIIALAVSNVLSRTWFLRQIFDGFAMARHIVRALLPSLPAVVIVLAVRALDSTVARTFGVAAGEVALYLAVTIAATWAFERPLLREAVGYLQKKRGGGAVAPA